ncbi:DUF3040 domain-containing protein [Pseudonocardia sp. Cha107L01]|uniref:DUF3040 domain-containing protein n=1 Tax=Pseudonocardia sp. Cha107L01 TaxID=3457576 RepID=UPI00403E380C
MTTLSRRDRRVLRRMERSLREDDPQWVSLFSEISANQPQVLGTRLCVVFLSLAAALILASVGLDDREMYLGGLTVLGLLPLVVVLVMLADRGPP